MKNEETPKKLSLKKVTLKNLTVHSNIRTGSCTNNSGGGSCGSGDSTGGPGDHQRARM